MLSPAASRNDSAAGYFICSRGKPEIQTLCLGGVAEFGHAAQPHIWLWLPVAAAQAGDPTPFLDHPGSRVSRPPSR